MGKRIKRRALVQGILRSTLPCRRGTGRRSTQPRSLTLPSLLFFFGHFLHFLIIVIIPSFLFPSLLSSSAHLHSSAFLLFFLLFSPPPRDISSLYFVTYFLHALINIPCLPFSSSLSSPSHRNHDPFFVYLPSSVFYISHRRSLPSLFLLYIIIVILPFYLFYVAFYLLKYILHFHFVPSIRSSNYIF